MLKSIFEKKRTVILYFFIGVSAAALDYIIFLFLFNILELSSVLSTALSIGTVTVYAFVLNVHYNFKVKDRLFLRFISYSAVSFAGMLFSMGFLYVLNVRFGFNGNVVKLLSLPIIFVLQYSLNKAISFKKISIK